ncbi:hypothetical protein ACH4GK_31965 [Streptomyces rimosus]|uniref:hypothetical protein n=1 Tax=Streptomyces rimosus TaxID=1927 RepID=UPI00099BF375|nr:hypothetical protein [Streptomyces rimosus]
MTVAIEPTAPIAALVSVPRELPAGNPRSSLILDAAVEVLRAAGEDVHVVYSAHGDVFKIVPREAS